MQDDGRRSVVISGGKPEIDGGRFPIKRAAGECVCVETDVFADRHDSMSCAVLYRRDADRERSEVPMQFLANDQERACPCKAAFLSSYLPIFPASYRR